MLTWEKLSDHQYRARLPVFGNVRVESYTAGKWDVNASVPGISMGLIEQSFKTEAEALDAANALVADACRDFLDQAPTVRGGCE